MTELLFAVIVEHREAVSFIEQHHYCRSAPNTSTYRFGAWLGEELVGAAIWIPPTKNAASTVNAEWKMVLSLSRFALRDGLPKNSASKFLGWQMRQIDRRRWPTLLTYADTSVGHVGTIYKATNWVCLGPVAAGDVWVGPNGERRGRKRGQRTWTKSEMEAAGFEKVPPAPKIKYFHHVNTRSASR
jgi:hypothetical protein